MISYADHHRGLEGDYHAKDLEIDLGISRCVPDRSHLPLWKSQRECWRIYHLLAAYWVDAFSIKY